MNRYEFIKGIEGYDIIMFDKIRVEACLYRYTRNVGYTKQLCPDEWGNSVKERFPGNLGFPD